MKTRYTEHGRSMIEMLGVLAIIGILSLGAIAGYRLGISKHRANETVNELNRLATIIATQMHNENVSDAIFDDVPDKSEMGYALDSGFSPDPTKTDYFELAVYDMPTSVCENILSMNWATPTAISVIGQEEGTDNGKCGVGSTASMIFEFNKDMGPASASGGSSSGGSSSGGGFKPPMN